MFLHTCAPDFAELGERQQRGKDLCLCCLVMRAQRAGYGGDCKKKRLLSLKREVTVLPDLMYVCKLG